MSDLTRLLLLLAIAGTGVTFAGSAALWLGDAQRRLTGALRRVLGGTPDAQVIALGHGQGAAFSLATRQFAVAWDSGRWCLLYPLEEVEGAELILDDEVMARVRRDEPRRALDRVTGATESVRLRLLFDEPGSPEFVLDLWEVGDEARREAPTPAQAIKTGNQWLARIEAILRRPPRPVARDAPPDEDELTM